jgi:two-component system nitrate/nitrite response regulator NarL
VLQLLAEGASTQTVAERLFISRATARHHIDNIMIKLGVHSRLEAVTYALRERLIYI